MIAALLLFAAVAGAIRILLNRRRSARARRGTPKMICIRGGKL